MPVPRLGGRFVILEESYILFAGCRRGRQDERTMLLRTGSIDCTRQVCHVSHESSRYSEVLGPQYHYACWLAGWPAPHVQHLHLFFRTSRVTQRRHVLALHRKRVSIDRTTLGPPVAPHENSGTLPFAASSTKRRIASTNKGHQGQHCRPPTLTIAKNMRHTHFCNLGNPAIYILHYHVKNSHLHSP